MAYDKNKSPNLRLCLTSTVEFGKYKGKNLQQIIDTDFEYVNYLNNRIHWVLDEDVFAYLKTKNLVFKDAELKPYTDDTIITFGAHKGKKLSEIPDQWLYWLSSQNVTDKRLRVYIDANLDAIKKNLNIK